MYPAQRVPDRNPFVEVSEHDLHAILLRAENIKKPPDLPSPFNDTEPKVSHYNANRFAANEQVDVEGSSGLPAVDTQIDSPDLFYRERGKQSISVMPMDAAARGAEGHFQTAHLSQAFELIAVLVELRIDFLKTNDLRSQFAYDPRDAFGIEPAVDSDELVNIVAGNGEAVVGFHGWNGFLGHFTDL